jgi:UDP-N-acetylglucosamine 2-epimerase
MSSLLRRKPLAVAFVFGTRPEVIKLAPVILEARRRNAAIRSIVINTGQHREMVDSLLRFFSIKVDIDLSLMQPRQTLASLTSRAIVALDKSFSLERPELVVVQGDTTTALCAAIAAFYRRTPVAHIEAGLRTDNLLSPFPEEANRRIISQVSSWHFAPTARAASMLHRDNLGVLGGKIAIVGNTVIDALLLAIKLNRSSTQQDEHVLEAHSWKQKNRNRQMVLITGHRRENFGAPLNRICRALVDLAKEHPRALLFYPVHLNPNVQDPARTILSGVRNVRLLPPKDYPAFIQLMSMADLIITDSGGIQEEAPALGKPVLVTRESTERPEALETGLVKLVGSNRARILSAATSFLSDHSLREGGFTSPYGDGFAARRCIKAILGESFDEFYNEKAMRT